MKKIYQQTVKEVLDRVKSRESGLTDEEVKISGKELIENGFSAHIPEKRTAKLYFYHTIQ